MLTIVADLQNLSSPNSRTTTSWVGTPSGNKGSVYYSIHEGYKIRVSDSQATAIVIQPFDVRISPTEEEYIATSYISNLFELGETPGQAIRNYLEMLVDALTWLKKHEANLSPSVFEELRLLQSYLRIV